MSAVFPLVRRLTGRDFGGDGVHQRGVPASFGIAARLAAADHAGGESALGVGPVRPRPRFGHGASASLDGWTLLGSYHRIDDQQTNPGLWIEATSARQWMQVATGDDIAANRSAVLERGREQVR